MSSREKTPIGENLMKKRICALVESSGYGENVQTILLATYDYMRRGLWGGCHALSAVLFVAFSELGLNSEILVGECQKPGAKPFDHSWIAVDGRIVDLAIYMPLTRIIGSVTGPVVFDTDVVTMNAVETAYGINTGLPMSDPTTFSIEAPLTLYMDKFPFGDGGLWPVVRSVMPSGIDIDIQTLKDKHSSTMRHFVR